MTDSDSPEWLPDEYDPDGNLRERLPIMAEIDRLRGAELHAADDRGLTKILGTPFDLEENPTGTLTLHVGGSQYNWDYEVVVPSSDTPPFVRSVDMEQDIEDYERAKKTELENVDVRIYDVDHDRLEATEASA
ncbi:hypothetical protein [Natrinema pallidum]|uniref:Uncharacterized protein n=1 Tax=Natrinema pallidum DSM 3751 TaxID=1227495 RepID=L9YGL7_9EURY|nr:hypothetical protein [Natrinema pallidum]ELY73239.1 hypothetical protein C487_17595 [Natrinema pallidum DSM 3751]